MREYTKQSEKTSRTLDSNPKASRQAPFSEILQAYKNGTLGRQTVQRENTGINEEDEELIQPKSETIQKAEKPNNTGLPDDLKTGIENLSGYSMDDVQVHYNSDRPAQLNALAYAQGTDIHVGPGQEKHLPHEAWHVVQQKQGRVKPTMQMQGENVNDNEGLEKEADVMAGKAVQMMNNEELEKENVQMKISGGVIQRTERQVTFDDVKTLYSEQISETKTEEILKARDSVQNRLSGVSGIFLGDTPNDWREHSAVGYGANDVLKVVLPDFDAFNRTQTFGFPILDSNGLSILENCKMIALHELTHLKHSRENLNIGGSGFNANTRITEFGDINLPLTVNSLINDVNILSINITSEGHVYSVPRLVNAKNYIDARLNYILNTYNAARTAGRFNNAEAPSVMIELNFYLQRLLLPEKMNKNEKDGWKNLKKRISDLDNACKKSVKMK